MEFIKIYIIDIILILIFLLCLLYYYQKGFVRSILSVFCLFASLVLTKVLSPFAVVWLCENIGYFKSDFGEYKANIAAVALVFILLNIVFGVIIFAIDKIFELPVLKTVNKALGFLLGAVCGLIVIAVSIALIRFVYMFDFPEFRKAVDSSVIIKLYSQIMILIYPTIDQFIKGGLKK